MRETFLWPEPPDPSTWSSNRPGGRHRVDYVIAIDVDVVKGHVECIGITVTPRKGAVITGALLREIPIGRLVQRTVERHEQRRRALMHGGDTLPDNAHEMDDEWFRRRAAFWERAKVEAEKLAPIVQKTGYASRGRRYPPDHLQHVARLYREVAGLRRDPTAAVAETYGVTRTAAAKWVARAREKGLLAPAPQRRSKET